MQMKDNHFEEKPRNTAVRIVAALVAVVAGVVFTVPMLTMLLGRSGSTGAVAQESVNVSIMEKYDMYMTNTISDALNGILSIEKVYWLSDDDLIAPVPNPECYGETNDPASLGWLLEEASDLLEGQELIFSPDTQIKEGSRIKYYLDETILAITWQQQNYKTTFTFTEVKIRHPSQFRRFLSGGEYGSGILYTTTEMATSVNAVAASSADYYSYRSFGNVVYNGEVKRSGDSLLDTCYIDENGDLLFVDKGEIMKLEDVQRYVEENNIRFSLAFGPVLIRDGVPITSNQYNIGETRDFYSRAALCQQDKLHYVVVAVEGRKKASEGATPAWLARKMQELGCVEALNLDGGGTAVMIFMGQVLNRSERNLRSINSIIGFGRWDWE